MPPAKKAAPAAAKADEPDLLSDLKDDGPAPVADDETESFDLLDGLSEDEGTPWIPDDEDDPSPEGIQGRVKFLGTVPSEYGPEECPYVELEAADGTIWSVRGYATVLRNQITKANPQVGDLMAVRYFGVKTGKGKNAREYKNYKVVVKHA
jgi:hypothetical protein